MNLPAPSAHGGDGPAVAKALGIDLRAIVDLSQSLNPVAPDVAVVAARHLSSLGHYPDVREAKNLLADHMGIDVERLLLTNGGAEAIALVANEVGGSVVEPEFALHPRHGGPRWRSNPHNPTGLLAKATERADVWDEAFYGLATGAWTRGDRDSTIVGSLTKLFACPGLRIGYVIANPQMIERVSTRQTAWSVNSLALAMLPEMLDRSDLPQWNRAIVSLRCDLVEVLASHGIQALPSDANWVLVSSPHLRERLLPFAIVIRDCSSFGLRDVSRIAVPKPEQLDRLDRALGLIT